MKKTVRIGNRVIAVDDATLKAFKAYGDGKRKPKLKRAADRAWERVFKTVAAFQPPKDRK